MSGAEGLQPRSLLRRNEDCPPASIETPLSPAAGRYWIGLAEWCGCRHGFGPPDGGFRWNSPLLVLNPEPVQLIQHGSDRIIDCALDAGAQFASSLIGRARNPNQHDI